jgi:hypothetical protein
MGELGFEKEALGSLTIRYSKGRIITYKLVSQFDIDTLVGVENFEFTRESKSRSGEQIINKLGCRIRGIHKARARAHTQASSTQYTEEGYRWVKIEGAEYRLDRSQIGSWLEFWGKLASEITEDKIEEDSEDSEGGHAIGNGTYSVKMKLDSDLPQFLPMFGKRIRLYYRGILKKCSNCFGPHARKACNRERVAWIEYVSDLMKAKPEIPDDFYGKWAPYVREWREKTGNNVKAGPNREGKLSTSEMDQIIQTGSASEAASEPVVTSHAIEPVVAPGAKSATHHVQGEIVIDNQTKDVNVDKEVSAMLSRLRGQGLLVSSTAGTKQVAAPTVFAVKSKAKIVGETGRGRGRRKTSLN